MSGYTGYLGPRGTFTNQALLKLLRELGGDEEKIVAYPTVPQSLNAVRSGEVNAAVVPIENSIEGGVSASLDYLATPNSPLQIVAETVVPVNFNLYVRPGTKHSNIHTVISHPHAIAQVRGWLADNLPDVEIIERGSTAGAAASVAAGEPGCDAAVSAEICGELYGLEALATEIGDNQVAATRFVMVTKAGPCPPVTGHDKTTFVAYLRQDRSGALLEILQQLAVRGVNLCRIESRPAKTALGEYCFSIDAEGHIFEARLAGAMQGLHRVCKEVVFLGSYPRADKVRPKIMPGATDEDYAAAQAWLQTIQR